jgi:hypothetical protein
MFAGVRGQGPDVRGRSWTCVDVRGRSRSASRMFVDVRGTYQNCLAAVNACLSTKFDNNYSDTTRMKPKNGKREPNRS